LTTAHKEAIVKDQELDDMYINVARLLLKQLFPELGGLQNVLLNNKARLHYLILITPYVIMIHLTQHYHLLQSKLLQIYFMIICNVIVQS